jgi:uncharacterized membrane protein YqiK
MATDTDTTAHEDQTQAETSAETATTKAGADQAADRATEQLRAENERIKKALAEANRKATADRKRLEDIDREKQEREDEKLGEGERLKKQLKESDDRARESEQRAAKLEDDLLQSRIDQAIERAAAPLFLHPEVASRLVDRARILHDPETGKITGIKDALEAVLKQYPGLALANRGGGSPQAMRTRRPGDGGGEKTPGLREEFARLGNYEPM